MHAPSLGFSQLHTYITVKIRILRLSNLPIVFYAVSAVAEKRTIFGVFTSEVLRGRARGE